MKKIILVLFLLSFRLLAQDAVKKAPEIKEGDGPYAQLIIRGVMLIDGTGAPPIGPVDIVVEKNRIREIRTVGFPGVPIDSARRPPHLIGLESRVFCRRFANNAVNNPVLVVFFAVVQNTLKDFRIVLKKVRQHATVIDFFTRVFI